MCSRIQSSHNARSWVEPCLGPEVRLATNEFLWTSEIRHYLYQFTQSSLSTVCTVIYPHHRTLGPSKCTQSTYWYPAPLGVHGYTVRATSNNCWDCKAHLSRPWSQTLSQVCAWWMAEGELWHSTAWPPILEESVWSDCWASRRRQQSTGSWNSS